MKIPLFKNTLTNYLVAGIRLLEGVVLSRWIIEYLGMAEYGLWALLWSFFIYAILLDFGCGAAAQKYTSGGMYEQDPKRYSAIISGIVSYHCLMGVLVIALTFGASFFLSWLLKIDDPEKLRYARSCFLLFGCGAGVLFGTGVFPEILVGLQKIYLRNYVTILTKIVELAGVSVICARCGDLRLLIAFALGMILLSNLGMALLVKRELPELKLRITFDFSVWKEIAGFSGFIFLGVLARLILSKSSRVLISIFYGMTSVGIFQLSSKLADLCQQGVCQYQENISPLTGALYKRGKKRLLGKIILGSMQWNHLLACGATLICWMLAEPLLMALFRVDNPEVVRLSRLFLISMYLSMAFRMIPHRFFIMAGKHQLETAIIGGEAAANLILNVILLRYFSCEVVIWNSLAVKLFITLFLVLPILLAELRTTWRNFLGTVLARSLAAGIPVTVFLLVSRKYFPLQNPWGALVLEGGAAAGIYFLMTLLLLPSIRRRKYQRKIGTVLRKIQGCPSRK